MSLLDVEETIVAKVLSALTSLCELGLFQKMKIWEMMSATLGFLYHPNVWIRQGLYYGTHSFPLLTQCVIRRSWIPCSSS